MLEVMVTLHLRKLATFFSAKSAGTGRTVYTPAKQQLWNWLKSYDERFLIIIVSVSLIIIIIIMIMFLEHYFLKSLLTELTEYPSHAKMQVWDMAAIISRKNGKFIISNCYNEYKSHILYLYCRWSTLHHNHATAKTEKLDLCLADPTFQAVICGLTSWNKPD